MLNNVVTPQIIWYEELDSTNSQARREIEKYDDMSVLAAKSQTAGRGQGDHKWHSVPCENLTVSFVLKHDGFPANLQMTVSAAIVATMIKLLKSNGIDAWFKWPNDIYVDKCKICGILIEHGMKNGCLSWSIIGVGLNVNQTEFPSDLPNPVSMKLLDGKDRDVAKVLEELASIFADTFATVRGSLPEFSDIVSRTLASENSASGNENLRAGFAQCVNVLL